MTLFPNLGGRAVGCLATSQSRNGRSNTLIELELSVMVVTLIDPEVLTNSEIFLDSEIFIQ